MAHRLGKITYSTTMSLMSALPPATADLRRVVELHSQPKRRRRREEVEQLFVRSSERPTERLSEVVRRTERRSERANLHARHAGHGIGCTNE